MFQASVEWVGLIVAGATVALRLYLRESQVALSPEHEAHIQHLMVCQKLLKEAYWNDRDRIVDMITLHDCGIEQTVRAQLSVVGLDPEQWVMGALVNDRVLAES